VNIDQAGYRVEPEVLSPIECDALLRAIATPSRSRAGARHLMSNSYVAEAAHDPRLLRLASEALNCPPIPFRATLFEKSGDKNWLIAWHQDTALPLESQFDAPSWGPWSRKAGIAYAHAPAWALSRVIALRLHLDPSTSENGPLRMIPGSHSAGLLTDPEVAQIARSTASVECPVPRGGVLAMRPLLIHASSKARGADPRRVLHIEYADSLDLAVGITLAVV
jgi:ectoine hydroxylase-related dioxygenase (phytanoyl-CoA dioxygenase family)